jgi:hypothetical protein
MVLPGLAGAQIGFVWEWRSVYLHELWCIFDIRDGGWEAVAGFAASRLCGLVFTRRQPVLRRPILATTFTLLVSWTAGAVAIATLSATSSEPIFVS